MLVSAIVAVAKNNVIGKDNEIPWYLPGDLAWFKRTTLGHHVIMGRNSFRSIGRPLPKRTNVVITRDPYFSAEGVLVAHSIEEALGLAYDNGETEAFIIGGGAIYRDSMDLWDRLYLTEVDIQPEGDVFFPEIEYESWRESWREAHEPDTKNEYGYIFRILERIPVSDEPEP
ncbi:MAG: dihydrofolate reductase [Lewinellaceae bacterium]|nr:dihydrofolate reductase [Saprospiraceae bacterium]MCB9314580.1 dihydrofolate reductase [Lewinellaceae bacterium]MCB9332589.1 dihydrofolate reductase [Lewinellaceae bacterium]